MLRLITNLYESLDLITLKKQLPYFLIAFAIPVIAMLWWWGLFSSATVNVVERGDYRYAYLEVQGPYSKLANKQNEVLFELSKQAIQPGMQISVVMSDPRTTAYDQLKARTGFMIKATDNPGPPLLVGYIAARKVAVAEIKAHPLLAYGKTYSALLDYARAHQITLHLPTIEIFDKSILRVEMPLELENVDTKQKTAGPKEKSNAENLKLEQLGAARLALQALSTTALRLNTIAPDHDIQQEQVSS